MKKVFTLILALMLVLAVSAPALAANTTGGTTTVTYEVGAAYTVTIPEAVQLGATGAATNSDLAVDITNIPFGTCINAAITGTSGTGNAFTVKHTGDVDKTLSYTVKSSTDGTTYADYALNDKVGGRTASGTIYFQYTLGYIPVNHPSGTYTGSVTFAITNEAVGS